MDSNQVDGGPAFPVVESTQRGDNGEYWTDTYSYGGMTLRDYFAAKAMGAEAFGMRGLHDHITVYDRLAEHAYKMADAMLKARSA